MASACDYQTHTTTDSCIDLDTAKFPGSYLLVVRPPLTDAGYGSFTAVTYKDRRTGVVEEYDTRQALLDAGQAQLDRWRERYEDNDDLPDAPPTADRTTLAVTPTMEGEVTVREFFGDATLASFGAGASTRPLQERPWYEVTPEYEAWLVPLQDHADLVLAGVFGGWAGAPLAYGSHIWIRAATSGDGFEAIYRDGTAINGPEPVDTTTVVRWLGDYRAIDEALAWRSLRARKQTPFGHHWSYNSLPKHPRYVNGWSWVTRHGGWLHADGHCILATHGNYLDIRDVRSKDMGGRFVARPWPSDRTGSDLTEAEARRRAVAWLREHPASEWDHPLRPAYDRLDEYGSPPGFVRRAEGGPGRCVGPYGYHGDIVEHVAQRYNRLEVCYDRDCDTPSREASRLWITGTYTRWTAPDADENGPFRVVVTYAGGNSRTHGDNVAAEHECETLSAALAKATDLAADASLPGGEADG